MTDILERAIQTAKALPPDVQDDVGRMVLRFLGEGDEQVELTEADLAALQVSRDAAARGDFATDEQMRAIWAKYDL